MNDQIVLKRSISLPLMVLYGLGTTIGAGIYALVGELAAVSGYMAPLSFLLASLMAGLTALSFAELSGRYPKCAGASLYVREGFASIRLSTFIGLLVMLAGLVSSAALINGFVGYLHQFIELDRVLVIVIISLLLGAIAAWGIAESVTIAAIITIIEIGGLVMIIVVSTTAIGDVETGWHELMPTFESSTLGSVFAGSLLAFYAFIGFEDMVEVAEETRQVKRTLPVAIILTLAITTLLYMSVMITAVLTVPLDGLIESKAPLAFIYSYHTGERAIVVSVIGLFAIINGALIQMVMVSRVLYGLGSRGQLPGSLSLLNPRTRTPLFSTMLVTFLVLVLALMGSLAGLAESTSIIMLAVFSMVNLSLCRIKLRDPMPANTITFPYWIPVAGFMVSTGFVLSSIVKYLH